MDYKIISDSDGLRIEGYNEDGSIGFFSHLIHLLGKSSLHLKNANLIVNHWDILLGVNLKAYKDFKDTNSKVKKYSFISIILSLTWIIMFVVFKFI